MKFLLAAAGLFGLFLVLASPLRFVSFKLDSKVASTDARPEAQWIAQQIAAGNLRGAFNGEIATWLEAEPGLDSLGKSRLEAAQYFDAGRLHSGSYVILKPIDFNTAPASLQGGTFIAPQAGLVPGVTIWSMNPHQCFGSSCP